MYRVYRPRRQRQASGVHCLKKNRKEKREDYQTPTKNTTAPWIIIWGYLFVSAISLLHSSADILFVFAADLVNTKQSSKKSPLLSLFHVFLFGILPLFLSDDDTKQNNDDKQKKKAAALANKMRGLKKKRKKFTRTLEGTKNQKQSAFDYATFREENSLRAANAQQIMNAVAPAKQKSPLKAEVKRERDELKAAAAIDQKRIKSLRSNNARKEKNIQNLKEKNRHLLMELRREKKASNKIIDDTMVEARLMMAEALEINIAAGAKVQQMDRKLTEAKASSTNCLRQQRQDSAEKASNAKKRARNRLAKIEEQHADEKVKLHERGTRKEREHSDEMEKARKKCIDLKERLTSENSFALQKERDRYAHVKARLAESAVKLTQQRSQWEQRLREMDTQVKLVKMKERLTRRKVVQRELDRAAATEKQLHELIDGLNQMNDELSQEVNDATTAAKEAKATTREATT